MNNMEAGSKEAIAYAFFQLIDELIHALPWFPSDWEFGFANGRIGMTGVKKRNNGFCLSRKEKK